jgi:hypothetical protein
LIAIASVGVELSFCRSAFGLEIVPGVHVPPTVASVVGGVTINQVQLAAIGWGLIDKLLIPKFIRKLVDEWKHLSLPQHNVASGYLAFRELERGNGSKRPAASTLK